MPRVIQILNRLVIGGPLMTVLELAENLPNFESILITGGKDDDEKEADHLIKTLNIKIIKVDEMKRSINPLLDYIAYNKIKKIIHDYKPDVVHTHAAKAGMIGRIAAKHCNVKVVVHTFHGHVFHSYFGKTKTRLIIELERKLAGLSTGIIAISDQQKEEIGKVYRICSEDKIKIIPLGLDIDKFSIAQKKKREIFRLQFLIEEDEVAIGIIGRIVPIKNHEFFIRLAQKISSITGKKLRFFIIGDGEARPAMEKVVQEYKLDYTYYPQEKRKSYITCTSWILDIAVPMSGLDIVVLNSHNEGTPVSLIEAQAAGKPVVSSDVGGVRDVITNNKTGYLVQPGNMEQFVSYLLKLIDDPVLRRNAGEEGRKLMKEKFSNQTMLNDTAAYFSMLLKNKDNHQ